MILNYKRKKGFRGNTGILHENDYELVDSKLIFTSPQTQLQPSHIEKIWFKANQKTEQLGEEERVVHYFYNNYSIDKTGKITNIDTNSEFYRHVKAPIKNGDLFYADLHKSYEYFSKSDRFYTGYHLQQYPVACIVACNFVYNPNPSKLKYVEFIDGNRLNHHADNLRWVDKKTKKSLKILR